MDNLKKKDIDDADGDYLRGKKYGFNEAIDEMEITAPYRCPICYGTGKVPQGFYLSDGRSWISSSMEKETCRSCGGSGIVWEASNG